MSAKVSTGAPAAGSPIASLPCPPGHPTTSSLASGVTYMRVSCEHGRRPLAPGTGIHTELTRNPRGALRSAPDDGARQSHPPNHKDDHMDDGIGASRGRLRRTGLRRAGLRRAGMLTAAVAGIALLVAAYGGGSSSEAAASRANRRGRILAYNCE